MCALNTKSVKGEFQHAFFFSNILQASPPYQRKIRKDMIDASNFGFMTWKFFILLMNGMCSLKGKVKQNPLSYAPNSPPIK